MKILQLGKFFFDDVKGGLEKVVYDIFSNIECDILCSNVKRKYEELVFGDKKVFKVKRYGCFFSLPIAPQIIFKLYKIKNNYDIIHLHLPDPISMLALRLSGFEGVVIVHWHSDIVKQKTLLKFIIPIQNWVLRRADKIIATTPKYIDESKYLRAYKDKCISIPIGIDKLTCIDKCVPKILREYKGKKIVFSLGRLVYYKGFEYLIKSANYLSDDYIIIIGGEGKMMMRLQKIIEYNNLNKKVILQGKIPYEHLFHYYNQCQVFVLPSIYKSEAFGIVQIEAMSFGKPVVATKISESGVDWVNKHKVSGLNVRKQSSKKIAQAIIALCSDEFIYDDYSKKSYDRYEKFFHIDMMITSLNKLYNLFLYKI